MITASLTVTVSGVGTPVGGGDEMSLLGPTMVDCLTYRILMLTGEIDPSVGGQLLALIVGLLNHGNTPLLIDMTGVTFCDTTGVRIAIGAKWKADASRCALAFCLSEPVEEIFNESQVDRFLTIYPTMDDAARDLNSWSHGKG